MAQVLELVTGSGTSVHVFLDKAGFMARPGSSGVAVCGILPLGWVVDIWICDTIQQNDLVVFPSKA